MTKMTPEDRNNSEKAAAPHPASLPVERLIRDCDFERLRRSGPGGQHRNKVETAVRITHRPTGLRGEASERRSQADNRTNAIHRLRVRLALDVRCDADPDSEPSECWQSKIVGGRVQVNPAHEDFPTVLAEALDLISMFGYDITAAGDRLGCSSSQLVRLLKKEAKALELVNRKRQEQGMATLR